MCVDKKYADWWREQSEQKDGSSLCYCCVFTVQLQAGVGTETRLYCLNPAEPSWVTNPVLLSGRVMYILVLDTSNVARCLAKERDGPS